MSQRRRHDIDALRALAFGLLILYHVGMYYVSWDWHLKSRYPAEWLEPIMLLVNQWRMPLIFLISGLAVNFLLGEGPQRRIGLDRFAWLRVKRLGWPLLFGMLMIIPPQAYFEARFNGAFEGGYGAFLLRYLTLQPWPDDAFIGAHIGVTWNHLWYLAYLLFYTLVLAFLLRFAAGPMAALRAGVRRLRGPAAILVPVGWLMLLGLFVFPLFPYIRMDFYSDWYAHSLFGSFFLFGYCLGRDDGLWEALRRLRRVALPLALLGYLAIRLRNTALPEAETLPTALLDGLVTYLNRWLWIVALLGWAYQWLNRPMSWLTYANKAVYPWYILHQTLIVMAGYYLAGWALGPLWEPVLLITITVAGCALGTYLVEHHFTWLRTALGMKSAISGAGKSSPATRVTADER